MPQGEKGILEAYLRGIASAKEFIYLETQYFTNDAIGDGLVNALLSEPNLKVIVLLNIEPDVPTYPFKQRRLITRIRRAIGQTPTGPQRFGVFTRWTHESVGERVTMMPSGSSEPDPQTKDPRPRLLPVYIHAKVGDRRQHLGDGRLGQPRRTVARLVLAERHPERLVPSRRAAGHRGQRRLLRYQDAAEQRGGHPAAQAVGGAPRVPDAGRHSGHRGQPPSSRPETGSGLAGPLDHPGQGACSTT